MGSLLEPMPDKRFEPDSSNWDTLKELLAKNNRTDLLEECGEAYARLGTQFLDLNKEYNVPYCLFFCDTTQLGLPSDHYFFFGNDDKLVQHYMDNESGAISKKGDHLLFLEIPGGFFGPTHLYVYDIENSFKTKLFVNLFEVEVDFPSKKEDELDCGVIGISYSGESEGNSVDKKLTLRFNAHTGIFDGPLLGPVDEDNEPIWEIYAG